jgi:hypothetical protein
MKLTRRPKLEVERRQQMPTSSKGHKKRTTAGLLASAQTFALGPNIFAATLEWKQISDIVISTKETKRQQKFYTLKEKLFTLKVQNKTKEQIGRAEFDFMLVQTIR